MPIFFISVLLCHCLLGSHITEAIQTLLSFLVGDGYIKSVYIFTFLPGTFKHMGKKLTLFSQRGLLPPNAFFCVLSSCISNWVAPDQSTFPNTSKKYSVNVGWPNHLQLPLPSFLVLPVPSPLCWQIDQFEVSAFFLMSICKHLFMGFLLMHSILEKAKSTTFLEKFKFLKKQGGGAQEDC